MLYGEFLISGPLWDLDRIPVSSFLGVCASGCLTELPSSSHCAFCSSGVWGLLCPGTPTLLPAVLFLLWELRLIEVVLTYSLNLMVEATW